MLFYMRRNSVRSTVTISEDRLDLLVYYHTKLIIIIIVITIKIFHKNSRFRLYIILTLTKLRITARRVYLLLA